MSESNIHLHLSYDGTDYRGWQRQSTDPSIQGELEKVLKKVFKRDVKSHGAGRTDGGAHAIQYSAHFKTDIHSLPVKKIPLALNRHLPMDIRVIKAFRVKDSFHSRLTASAREYIYHIQHLDSYSPFWSRYTYYFPFEMDVVRLREILPLFKGEHDFKSFCYGYGDLEINTLRTIYYLRLSVVRGHLVFTIKGSGFLQGMIRSIISVCLSYMQGRVELEDVKQALKGGADLDPKFRMPVPAQGLFFKRAYYGTGHLE